MLPQRSEMGQGQPAYPTRSLPLANPNERPGRVQGRFSGGVLSGPFAKSKILGKGFDDDGDAISPSCPGDTVPAAAAPSSTARLLDWLRCGLPPSGGL